MSSSPPDKATASPHKYAFIDCMRGLAVLGVMGVHCVQRTPEVPAWLHHLLDSGQFGVQLFFMVSAFTLLNSMNSRKTEAHPTLNYFIRRFFRIAPLFWVGIAFYTFYKLRFPRLSVQPAPGLDSILATLTFTHGFFKQFINDVVPGGWSIAVEFEFYALVPLLAKWINTLSRALMFVAVGLALSFGLFLWLGSPAYESVPDFYFYWLPNQLVVFAIGFVLYHSLKGRVGGAHRQPWAPFLFFGSAVALAAMGAVFHPHLLWHIPFALGFFGLTFALGKGGAPWFETKWLRQLGVTSFSAYIWHFVCRDVVNTIAIKIGLKQDMLHLIFLFTGTVLLTMVLAEASRRLIEDPGQKLGKALIAWIESRRSSPEHARPA